MAELINGYYCKTRAHRASWETLGALLNVEVSDLKAIDKEKRGDTNDCLLEMLNVWLQSNPACPDEKLEKALCTALSDSQGKTCMQFFTQESF